MENIRKRHNCPINDRIKRLRSSLTDDVKKSENDNEIAFDSNVEEPPASKGKKKRKKAKKKDVAPVKSSSAPSTTPVTSKPIDLLNNAMNFGKKLPIRSTVLVVSPVIAKEPSHIGMTKTAQLLSNNPVKVNKARLPASMYRPNRCETLSVGSRIRNRVLKCEPKTQVTDHKPAHEATPASAVQKDLVSLPLLKEFSTPSANDNLKNYKIPKSKLVPKKEPFSFTSKGDFSEMEIDSIESIPITSQKLDQNIEWQPEKWQKIILEVNEARKVIEVNTAGTDISATTDETWTELAEDVDWFLVVDTNVFISALPFIRQIMSKSVPGRGYAVVYVPVRVIRELDHLKSRSGYENPEVGLRARSAIRFINTCLSVNHPRIKGQTYHHFLQMKKDENAGPDGEILWSCLQLRKSQDKDVVFLTNDINLRSKALIEKLETYSVEDLMANIEERRAENSKHIKGRKSRPSSTDAEKGFTSHEIAFKNILESCYSKVRVELENLQSLLVSGHTGAQLLSRIDCAIDALTKLLATIRDFSLMNACCDSSSPATRLLATSLAFITSGNSDSYIPALLGIASSEVGSSLLQQAEDAFSDLLAQFLATRSQCESVS